MHLMDVRFLDVNANKVMTKYMTSAFLGHATADNLLSAFNNVFVDANLSLSQLCEVSMDAPAIGNLSTCLPTICKVQVLKGDSLI